jgi:predicted RNA polymerase sigma factor
VWGVVAAFAVVTAAWSRHVGIPVRDPQGSILLSRAAISLGVLLGLALVDAAVRARQDGPGPRTIRAALRARWTRRRTALTRGGLLAATGEAGATRTPWPSG